VDAIPQPSDVGDAGAVQALSRRLTGWWFAAFLIALAAVLGVGLWFWNSYQTSPPLSVGVEEREGRTTAATGVFVEPGDGRAPILDEIESARDSIALAVYIVTDERILQALEAAHRRGVDVRVILEEHPFGGDGRQPEVFARLNRAGIAVRWGNPVFRFTHIKAMVVDDAVALIMNQNLTAASFDNNREFGVITTEPTSVRTTAAIFAADWVRGVEPEPDPLIVSPTNARGSLLALIEGAETSLELYVEVLRDQELLDALVAAVSRGVRVRLLVSPSWDNAEEREALAAAGIEVQLMTNLYVHAKLIVADANRAYIGSHNLSATSLDLNRELGIVLDDPVSLARLNRTFEIDFRTATPQALP
jgi:phosphatidylserine/phosphatidylglycerophosphate/cardiolipin synthase-like enzyme